MNKFLGALILLIISSKSYGQFTQITEPGIVIENTNLIGEYLKLYGGGGINYTLSFTNNEIRTNSPLFLSPNGAKVSIGPALSNTAQLNLAVADDNHSDLRFFGGDATIASNESIYFRLDDNGNADEYFSFKEGSTDRDLFWIGENGNNFLSGDLVINGRVKETAEKMHLINFLDFEVIQDFGDELEIATTYVAHHSDLINSSGVIAAGVHVPDQSRITGVTIGYRDRDDDGFMDIYLAQANTSRKIFSGNRSGSFDNFTSSGKISIDPPILVNYENDRYRIEVTSSDWDSQGIHHVIIHYINY